MKYLYLVALLVLLSACQEPTFEEKVPNVPGEIMYNDVLFDLTPATEITFFGIQLGDTTEDLIALHGEPDSSSDFLFARLQNFEYNLSQPDVAVVYHADRGTITGVLITKDANELLVGNTKVDHSLEEIFGLLGNPSRVKHFHLQQAYYYDSLGYEIFTAKKRTDRYYFTYPTEETSERVECLDNEPVSAEFDDECIEFPNSCLVPEEWEVVDSCDEEPEEDIEFIPGNSAPQIIFE